MLILSRKLGEGLRIGDDVRISIVEIRGDKVRIAIEAPATVPVHRDEIWEAIQRNKEQGDVEK